jgi:hypothetical protein
LARKNIANTLVGTDAPAGPPNVLQLVLRVLLRRIVDENVQSPQMLERVLYQPAAETFVADVARD